jgi:hypothetical protein
MIDIPLQKLDLPRKLLLTFVLAVLAVGFLFAEACVFERTGKTDGLPGLSLDDITFTFHGDRSMTPLKRAVHGSMKRYFSAFEDAAKLTPEEQADLDRIIAWNDAGAPEVEYLGKEWEKTPVYTNMERHGCFTCHASSATIIGNRKDVPLNTYAGVSRFTQSDHGMEHGRLALLSHIHLFGMALVFLLTGAAVAATLWPLPVRCVLAAAGPVSVLLTVGGWWAVKYAGAAWSPLVLTGGILMALAFVLSVLAVLYDLWVRRTEGLK